MQAVGVRGLDHQDVGVLRVVVVAKDRLIWLAEIAREEQPVAAVRAATNVQRHERASEDVAGIAELERDARENLATRVERHGRHHRHESVDVLLGVQRLEEMLALLAALLVDVLQVALLKEA